MKMRTYSNVVDPDHITVVEGDGVSSPDVLGVDISDSDVSERLESPSGFHVKTENSLDDNVLSTRDNTQTLTLNNTSRAGTKQSLVRGHSDTQNTGIITRHTH